MEMLFSISSLDYETTLEWCQYMYNRQSQHLSKLVRQSECILEKCT
jgi:hypothetical protein